MGPLLLIPCSIFLFLNSTREFSWLTLILLYLIPGLRAAPQFILCVYKVFFFPSLLPSPSCQLSSHWMPLLKRRFHQQQVGGDRIRNIFYHWHHAEPRIGKNGQCEHLREDCEHRFYTTWQIWPFISVDWGIWCYGNEGGAWWHIKWHYQNTCF